MLSRVSLLLAVGLSGLAVAEEASLCTRLSASLVVKGEAMAEACEAGLAECRTLAADYHVQLDSHRALCSSFQANSTASPMPGNSTGSPFPGNTTASPFPGNTTSSRFPHNSTAVPVSTMSPNGTHNGSQCLNGGYRHPGNSFCTCPPCYRGNVCQFYAGDKPFCPPLHNGTTWQPHFNASTPAPPTNASCPPCLNGGQAIHGQGCLCRCPSCFWGSTCQWRQSGCGGNGTTTVLPTPPSACASSPCRNGGTCFPYANARGYVCACQPSFDGLNCQHYAGTTTLAPPRTTTEKCHCVKRRFFVICVKWEPAGCNRNGDVERDEALQLCLRPGQQGPLLRRFCQDVLQQILQ